MEPDTQAEYVRIPFADNSLYHIPENADEEAIVMLSDILPNAFECGVLNGQVKPGDIVAIIGAGPYRFGSAYYCAILYSCILKHCGQKTLPLQRGL